MNLFFSKQLRLACSGQGKLILYLATTSRNGFNMLGNKDCNFQPLEIQDTDDKKTLIIRMNAAKAIACHNNHITVNINLYRSRKRKFKAA